MLWFWFSLVWRSGAGVVVPHLLGQHCRGLLTCLGGSQDSEGFCSHARCRFVCCVLRMLWLICVCSHIFICLGRGGAPVGLRWVSVVSFLSVAGGMAGVCCVLLFTFVYFSVGFIWKDGSCVVSFFFFLCPTPPPSLPPSAKMPCFFFFFLCRHQGPPQRRKCRGDIFQEKKYTFF